MQQVGRLVRAARGFDPFLWVWRLLTSLRLALALIAFLALAGLLGTLLPQIPGALRGDPVAVEVWLEEQRGKFGLLTDPLHDLGLFTLFDTAWFLTALGLLALSVAACAANRLPSVLRAVWRPLQRVPDAYFERTENRHSLSGQTDPAVVEAALRGRRFAVRRSQEQGATYLFADRFAWARLGTFVSHLSLIVLLAGALISRLGGFEESLFIAEGTSQPVSSVDGGERLQVMVEDAVARFDESGRPLDYRSELVVYDGGQEAAKGTATVNGPLHYGAYRFHQASYFGNGAALRVRDAATGDIIYSEVLVLGETAPAPAMAVHGADGQTLLQEIIPPTDFVATASGTLVTVPGSGRLLWVGVRPVPEEDRWQLVVYEPRESGEGIRLVVDEGQTAWADGLEFFFMGVTGIPYALEEGIPGSEDWALVEMATDPQGTPYLTVVGATGNQILSLYPGQPVEVDGREYTFLGRREFAGISVRKDPGTNFIWAAAGLLLLGLAIIFYVPRRRLWVRMAGGRTDIVGLPERSAGFSSEMRRLEERLGGQSKSEAKLEGK